MSWPQGILVYVVCWCVILLMTLPIGIHRALDIKPGQDPGAPEESFLLVKFLAVSVLAAVATWGIDLFISTGIVSVH